MLTPDEPPISAVNVFYENASNCTTDLTNNVIITINIYVNDNDKSIVKNILDRLRPDKTNRKRRRKT